MNLFFFILPPFMGLVWLGTTLRNRWFGTANLISLTAFCLVLIFAYGWLWVAMQVPRGVSD